jgi:hypothetical protein
MERAVNTDKFLAGIRADRVATAQWLDATIAQRNALDAQVQALKDRLAALDDQLASLTDTDFLPASLPALTGLTDEQRADVPLLLAFDQPEGLTRGQAREAARKVGKSPQTIGGLANGGWVISVEDAQGEIRRFLTDRSYTWLADHGIPTPNRAAAVAARDSAPIRVGAPV